jgi:FkbM family methyltransferase
MGVLMGILGWAKAIRLMRGSMRIIIWPLLVNPKAYLKFLPTAFTYLVLKVLGLKRYMKSFEATLMACYGLPLDESRVIFRIPGVRLIFPSDGGWIVAEILVGEVYNRFFKLASNSIVLDIGANAGAFTVNIAKKVKKGLVIAIEPHPVSFKFLTQNIKINELQNVIPLNIALGSKMGKTRLYLTGKAHTASTMLPTNRWLEVQGEILDNLVRRLKLKRVDFIKIDAEGAELEILKGGEEILKSDGLKLSMEASHIPSEARDITEFLKARGFTVWSLDDYLYAVKYTPKEQ